MANASGNVCRVSANLLVTDGAGQFGADLGSSKRGNYRIAAAGGGPHRQGLQNESILALLQCCAAKEAQRNRSENYWIQP
jgi:hypothetical protein